MEKLSLAEIIERRKNLASAASNNRPIALQEIPSLPPIQPITVAVRKTLAEILAEKKAPKPIENKEPELPPSQIESPPAQQRPQAQPAPSQQEFNSHYISDYLSNLLQRLNDQDIRATAIELDNLLPSEREVYYKQEQLLDREAVLQKQETFSLSITLNKEQLLAKELAFTGKSFVLTGAAGTGKTTAQREIAAELLRQNQLGTHTFRIQGGGGFIDAPSIAFCAYTRIASGNLRRAIHKDPALEAVLTHNITTIHNLLEYTPETFWDYERNK
jgi:flagellar biosynthesis GTPase FlhF